MVKVEAVKLTEPTGHVLVKEVNWLGDVVMSLPALKAVRRAFPEAKLALLVKRELASFFDGAQWIDEVIPYTVGRGLAGFADRRRLIASIRGRRFDLAILLPRSFEAALWATLARIPRRAGFAADARSLMLTHKTAFAPGLFVEHQVHDYLYMLRQTVGVEGSADDYVPDIHEPYRAAMRSWLTARRRRGRLIALAVAAAYGPAKEWPVAGYAGVIDRLAARYGAQCVLLGAPGERAKCEEVVAASRGGALVAAGEVNVGQAMALLSLCDGFAGNDSGPMHMAGALGLPTVGIYGSTRPFRTRPLGPKTKVLYHRIECSPCMARTCRFGHYECLQRIAPEEVVGALEGLGALE